MDSAKQQGMEHPDCEYFSWNCRVQERGEDEGASAMHGGALEEWDRDCVRCNEGGYFGKAKNLCEDHSGRGPSIYAMKKPDVVAPGTKIISCNSNYKKNPYIARSGTSMATPVVSGGLALLLQKNPEISNEEARTKLLHTARDLGEPWNKQGWGMIQIQKLLK